MIANQVTNEKWAILLQRYVWWSGVESWNHHPGRG